MLVNGTYQICADALPFWGLVLFACHCFTYCQVPIVYHNESNYNGIELVLSNGEKKKIDQYHLDAVDAANLFSRNGKISQIHIHFS